MLEQIITVANKEFKDGLRNRWLFGITFILTIFSLSITFLGGAASGSLESYSIAKTIASLSTLSVVLIPLIALILSYDSFAAEQESGTLLILLTYPVSKLELVLGKLVGQGLILTIATIIGIGISGVMLAINGLDLNLILFGFLRLIGSAILLGLIFISIGHLLSISVNEKAKAAGAALIIWFLLVLIFDLLVLGLLIKNPDLSRNTVATILLINPADLFRMINIIALDGQKVTGVLHIMVSLKFNEFLLFGLLITWLFITVFLTNLTFKYKRI